MPQGCGFVPQGLNWKNIWLWIATYGESTVKEIKLTLIDDFQVVNDVEDSWWFCFTNRTCYLHTGLFGLTCGNPPRWLNIRNNL